MWLTSALVLGISGEPVTCAVQLVPRSVSNSEVPSSSRSHQWLTMQLPQRKKERIFPFATRSKKKKRQGVCMNLSKLMQVCCMWFPSTHSLQIKKAFLFLKKSPPLLSSQWLKDLHQKFTECSAPLNSGRDPHPTREQILYKYSF